MAELVLKDLEVKAARKEFDFEPPDTTLAELFKAFVEYSQTNHAPATHRRYKGIIRNFNVFLLLHYPEVKKISQLSLALFEKYKSFRKNTDPRDLDLPESFPYKIPLNALKAKSKTINFEIKTLRSILNFAIKRDMCRNNPANGVVSLKVNDAKAPRFLTFEETDKFLENCPKSYIQFSIPF